MTAPKPTRANVDPEAISINPEFIVRQGERDAAHIRTLAQVVRNGRPLDPILLWRDPATGANALTLLDGAYRLAAYRTAKWRGPVPAKIVECSRKEALLLAAGANSKDRRGLSSHEKQDYAWKLVRDETGGFSKAELAKAAGLSERTIARMRSRWKELKQDPERAVTGRWWRDRDDREVTSVDEMTDAARRAAIKEEVKKLRDLLDRRKGPAILSDGDAIFEIIDTALGDEKSRSFAHWVLGDEDEADEWGSGEVVPVGEVNHLSRPDAVDDCDYDDSTAF